MWLGCEQPFLLGGALRDGPKNGCEGDYSNTCFTRNLFLVKYFFLVILKGVLKAVENVNKVIGPALISKVNMMFFC